MAMLTIGLLWQSLNSDNLGVGALTFSNIAIVENIAKELGQDVRFRVFCWRDPGTMQLQQSNVEVYQMATKELIDPRKYFREVRTCDMVLDISGGDSFADIYGLRRFHFNILSKFLILLAGKSLVLSPQTIGPFSHRTSLWLAKAMMQRAKAVVTRDSLSTEYVKQFNLKKVIEATDVAFKLPYIQAPKMAGQKPKVGINISGLLCNGGYDRNNMFSLKTDYPDLARKLVGHFAARKDCETHLVSHVISVGTEVEDDYRVAEMLAKDFPGTILAPRFANPPEAKSYISGMDYFCGSRMHACIAAFSTGVPVVPIAYSRKFSGLFGSLGYKHNTDCKTQTADEILGAVVAGFENRQALAAEVATAVALAQTKLGAYEDVLRSLMAKR
jgi:colanic acid/amylovoran biosynthesis protein